MLDAFRSFIEVVEQKSFTKAANTLGFSQPSISAHVKRLEAYFGTMLVDRSRGNKDFVITKNGEVIYDLFKDVIALMEQARAEISENNTADKQRFSLKIGSSFTIGNYFMPGIISEFLTASLEKNIQVELVIDRGERIAARVMEQDIDIGLVAGRIERYDELKRVCFASDQLILVAAADSGATERNLDGQVWILREETSDTFSYQRSYLEDCSIVPQESIIFSNDYAIKEALKKGLGVTLLPEQVISEELKQGRLIRLPMIHRIIRPYAYLMLPGKQLFPPLQDFISLLDNYDQNAAQSLLSEDCK